MKINHVWAMGFVVLGLSSSAMAVDSDPIETQVNTSVVNFHMVEPTQLYRGGRPGSNGLKALAEAGIKTVIDLQGGDRILGQTWEPGESDKDIKEEQDLTQSLGMNFISKPLNAMTPDFDDQSGTIDEVMKIINDPATPRPIFVHCLHGSDRTGLVGALYRVKTQGCTEAQAHKEMMDDGHSKYLFWIDLYFKKLVADAASTPAQSCLLPQN